MGQSWSRFQQKRNAQALLELAPKKTPGQEEPIPELDCDTLLGALGGVAAYVEQKGCHVTVIAIGGAVNTMYLRSRNTTHDVDFFNSRLTVKEYEHLINGAKRVAESNPLLQEEWFNNVEPHHPVHPHREADYVN